MTRVADEPCIVLHTRPYRESSLIVSLLSLRHGRLDAVAKGVRGGRRGRTLQPFVSLSAGWTGRTSLSTLTSFEAQTQRWFKGKALASAFYLSELIVRLVGEREAHPRLFIGLQWSLDNIETDLELVLRSFEKLLLEELGYGIDFELDSEGNPIEDQVLYQLLPDRGFQMSSEGFGGALLKRIGQEEFATLQVRRVAKKVLREALSHQLGPKPLASRRLLAGRR